MFLGLFSSSKKMIKEKSKKNSDEQELEFAPRTIDISTVNHNV